MIGAAPCHHFASTPQGSKGAVRRSNGRDTRGQFRLCGGRKRRNPSPNGLISPCHHTTILLTCRKRRLGAGQLDHIRGLNGHGRSTAAIGVLAPGDHRATRLEGRKRRCRVRDRLHPAGELCGDVGRVCSVVGVAPDDHARVALVGDECRGRRGHSNHSRHQCSRHGRGVTPSVLIPEGHHPTASLDRRESRARGCEGSDPCQS
mmetsp:Transcript_27564/g.46407  ORF Transcript_27564/g.46407 Transcript_27564/m.46407 type:complete len:204 (-) Transcript_27564:976-1587(-)